MKTVWAENLTEDNVLKEYPRPQFARDSYINLNGLWDFAVTQHTQPESYGEKILVPFSPECELSGSVTVPKANENLWYRREFTLPEGFNKGRVFLHFGAVDYETKVLVNGKQVGAHKGGYTSFSFDITQFLVDGANQLLVNVVDPCDTQELARGKQKTVNGGIWYTPQSGIWQTVWLESTPETYIKNVDIIPDFDEATVEFKINSSSDEECTIKIGDKTVTTTCNKKTSIDMGAFTPWTPQNPHLYNVELTLKSDSVKTYFAMRKVDIKEDENGVKRIYLNNEKCFCNGVLDQGYWSDGLYTAPSDEALIYDIVKMKELGFNTLRKHIKIEPLRWYYHCDRLGMLVWQDMINGGGTYKLTTITLPAFLPMKKSDGHYKYFAREDKAHREQFYVELEEMITALKNCPCIIMWVPFNEGWGQFDAEKAYNMVKKLDNTRLIDHASGWYDQGVGDFKSLHVYFRKYKFKADKLNRAVILSEFGGFSYKESTGIQPKKTFSYKRLTTREEFVSAVQSLYKYEIIPAAKQGLCASIYTQVADVQEEINGFMSYDRREDKVKKEELLDIFKELSTL